MNINVWLSVKFFLSQKSLFFNVFLFLFMFFPEGDFIIDTWYNKLSWKQKEMFSQKGNNSATCCSSSSFTLLYNKVMNPTLENSVPSTCKMKFKILLWGVHPTWSATSLPFALCSGHWSFCSVNSPILVFLSQVIPWPPNLR